MCILFLAYLACAVIFNPVIRFHFERFIWQIIDGVMITIMISPIVYECVLNSRYLKWKQKQEKQIKTAQT
ncbi:MAG TPA: hypothetical protein DD381_06140 [Lentisphaeria bacterium]|nr:MAG: hypothetical protein A2X47_05275 [Lentisphaerae bacterium GWF2_38_69]HBM15906.1 hypothetical protein [Lentisphaeria bacterium]